MRDLTEEELKLAPDWATHYIVDSFDDVVYQSENLFWWVNLISPVSHNNMIEGAVEITKKPFDITKHDFSDWEISSADFEYDEFTLRFFEVNAIHLNKDDAIAISKALGVAGEDLK